MNNFLLGRLLLPAAAAGMLAVPHQAAAQTAEECRVLAGGIQAGAAAAQKASDQVAPLGLAKVQVTALSLLLSQEAKQAGEAMDKELEDSLTKISGQFDSVGNALAKDQNDIVAKIVAAADVWEKLCRR